MFVFNKRKEERMPQKDIKISLQAARVNAKMSQAEMAKAIGVTQYTIANWESNKSVPNAIQLRRISELSGIPMDFIFLDM